MQRFSLGEVYYPISVGALFLLASGNWILYVIPILILTLSDAMAALIGIRYGMLRYQTADGIKSAEGSIAFFATAFLSVHVPLLLFTPTGRAETLLISAILGLLVMLLEAIAWRGIDNLLIPLGAYAFLKLYLILPPSALVFRLISTVVLIIFTLSWRRRMILDDSALIASALFAYAALMIGGPLWMIAPLILFLLHGCLWPHGTSGRHASVHAVLAVTAAPMLCLLGYAQCRRTELLIPYTVAFSTHLTFISLSTIHGYDTSLKPAIRAALSIILGWSLLPAVLVGMILMHQQVDYHNFSMPLLLCATFMLVGLAGAMFYVLMPRIYGTDRGLTVVHLTGATLATITACISTIVFLPK